MKTKTFFPSGCLLIDDCVGFWVYWIELNFQFSIIQNEKKTNFFFSFFVWKIVIGHHYQLCYHYHFENDCHNWWWWFYRNKACYLQFSFFVSCFLTLSSLMTYKIFFFAFFRSYTFDSVSFLCVCLFVHKKKMFNIWFWLMTFTIFI